MGFSAKYFKENVANKISQKTLIKVNKNLWCYNNSIICDYKKNYNAKGPIKKFFLFIIKYGGYFFVRRIKANS